VRARGGTTAAARGSPCTRTLPILLAGAVVLACAPPADRTIRLERLDAQRRGLEASLENLEARLTANQVRVRYWQEVRARHERESLFASASLDEPANELAMHAVPPPSRLHRSHVAAAAPVRARAAPPASVRN